MLQIIIVEDDPGLREALSLIFSPSQYKTDLYPDGDAVITGTFDVPDLFLLDRQLPGIDGLDICRWLKSNKATCHVPVIMMSANSETASLSKLAGADAFVEKPFGPAELFNAVQIVLRQ